MSEASEPQSPKDICFAAVATPLDSAVTLSLMAVKFTFSSPIRTSQGPFESKSYSWHQPLESRLQFEPGF